MANFMICKFEQLVRFLLKLLLLAALQKCSVVTMMYLKIVQILKFWNENSDMDVPRTLPQKAYPNQALESVRMESQWTIKGGHLSEPGSGN